jgi:hypothetical protein
VVTHRSKTNKDNDPTCTPSQHYYEEIDLDEMKDDTQEDRQPVSNQFAQSSNPFHKSNNTEIISVENKFYCHGDDIVGCEGSCNKYCGDKSNDGDDHVVVDSVLYSTNSDVYNNDEDNVLVGSVLCSGHNHGAKRNDDAAMLFEGDDVVDEHIVVDSIIYSRHDDGETLLQGDDNGNEHIVVDSVLYAARDDHIDDIQTEIKVHDDDIIIDNVLYEKQGSDICVIAET